MTTRTASAALPLAAVLTGFMIMAMLTGCSGWESPGRTDGANAATDPASANAAAGDSGSGSADAAAGSASATISSSTDWDPLGGLFPFAAPAPDTLSRSIDAGRGNAITRAVESASPAVVNITVKEVVQSRRSLIDEDFFRFFMNGYDLPREYTNIGSGFIISSDGLVVTNQHVVGNSPSSVMVTLTDGESFDAEVLGSDELTDLALLRIRQPAPPADAAASPNTRPAASPRSADPANPANPASDASTPTSGTSPRAFPHLRFSDSEKVQVGEWAIALGNPFGLFEDGQPTVTVGVISARNRDFRPDPNNPRVYMDMIQTDAAINRGNSGGPLLNSEGRVIGINTFIYTGGTGSGFVGLGFAIPSARIRMIISQLMSDGEIRLGFDMGMATTSMTEQLVYRYRLPMIQGLLVTEVNRDGPAFDAGILPGDIILQYGNERVVSQLHANALLRQHKAGDTLRIELLRNGFRYEAQVQLRDKVMAGKP